MADIKNVSASLKVLACGTSVPSGKTVTVDVFDADHPVHAGWIAEGQIEVTGDKPAKASKKASADKAAAEKAAADKVAADKAAAEDVLAKAQADYDAAEKAVLAEGSGADEATAFEAAEKALEAAHSALAAL